MEIRTIISFYPKKSKVEAAIIPIDSYGVPIGKGARDFFSRLGEEVSSTIGYIVPIPVGRALRIGIKGRMEELEEVIFAVIEERSSPFSPEDCRLAYREAILLSRGSGHKRVAIFLPSPLSREVLEEVCKGIYKDLRVYGKYFERIYLIGNSPLEKEVAESAKVYLNPF